MRFTFYSMAKHNYILDMIRFVAAFAVILFHLNLFWVKNHNWYTDLVIYGWLGVPMFFVLSGYCIMISAKNVSTPADFLIRRFFRIFPTYWVSLIVILCSAIFQKLYTGTNSVANLPHSINDIISTIFLVTYPLTKTQISNFVYWTLTCEIIFYLITSLSLYTKNEQLRIIIFSLVSVVSLFIPFQRTGYLFFFSYWSSFCLGTCLFLLSQKNSKTNAYLIILLTIINIYDLCIKHLSINEVEFIITVFLTLGIIILSNFVVVKENFISKLGKYSYAQYLIHVPIGVFVFARFKSSYIQHHPIITILYDLGIYALKSNRRHFDWKGI
ncbi:MAG: acyltransferase, partial [Pedobacter sp.]